MSRDGSTEVQGLSLCSLNFKRLETYDSNRQEIQVDAHGGRGLLGTNRVLTLISQYILLVHIMLVLFVALHHLT